MTDGLLDVTGDDDNLASLELQCLMDSNMREQTYIINLA